MKIGIFMIIGLYLISFCIFTYDKPGETTTQLIYSKKNYGIYSVYKKLLANTGRGIMIPLYVDDNSDINAYTDGSSVHIEKKLLELVHYDQNMEALFIAHELAHVVLGHTVAMKTKGSEFDEHIQLLKFESDADKMGAFLLMKSGFDLCKAIKGFELIQDKLGDSTTSDHPSWAYRIGQLTLPQCK